MILKSERFRWIRLKKPEEIPSQPGVYIFYDDNDQPIYIGKAKSLKKRLNSYWTKDNSKEGKILERAVSLDFIITDNEIEALILEGNLIKQYKPDHNVRLKDDKRYPYIKITNERFPRVFLTRKKIDDGSKYYGPYTRVDLIRRSLHILKGIFKIRDCNKKLEKNLNDEPCLNYHIERCSGPCSGEVDESDYLYYVNAVVEFINGSDMKQYVKDLENRLDDCKQKRQFEKASIISNDILSLKALQNDQKVELESEDDDIVNFSIKGNMAVIVVFSMRDGKIIGKEDYTLESENEIDEQELIQKFLVDRYSSEILNNRRIILPIKMEDELVLKWLKDISDDKFSIYTPAKGKVYRLLSLVRKNAEILINEKLWKKYYKDNLTTQDQIGKLFGLEKLENIEAIDISNLGFTDDVGVIVRFENGIPVKKYYRRYKIKNKDAEDDISRMEEVVKRSPASIGPFSKDTLHNTFPFNAIGALFSLEYIS
jgi:excinuclease ABC subunit C